MKFFLVHDFCKCLLVLCFVSDVFYLLNRQVFVRQSSFLLPAMALPVIPRAVWVVPHAGSKLSRDAGLVLRVQLSVQVMFLVKHECVMYSCFSACTFLISSLYKTPGGGPMCPIESGTTQCKPAIICSPWFINMLYNPWWCSTQTGGFGACCPDVRSTAG